MSAPLLLARVLARAVTRYCYQSSFRPNWIWRELVEVDVITPAVGDGPPVAAVYTTGFGVLKFVWLKMLKNSARNCRLSRSVKIILLVAEKSV